MLTYNGDLDIELDEIALNKYLSLPMVEIGKLSAN
jgi:hypothetical protein